MLSPPSFDLKLTAHLGDHLHLCSSRLWCAFVLSSFEALGLPVWSYNHVFINQSEFILKNNYGIDSVTGGRLCYWSWASICANDLVPGRMVCCAKGICVRSDVGKCLQQRMRSLVL